MEGLRVGKNMGWAAPCGLADVPRRAPQALERLFGAESVLHTLPGFPWEPPGALASLASRTTPSWRVPLCCAQARVSLGLELTLTGQKRGPDPGPGSLWAPEAMLGSVGTSALALTSVSEDVELGQQ